MRDDEQQRGHVVARGDVHRNRQNYLKSLKTQINIKIFRRGNRYSPSNYSSYGYDDYGYEFAEEDTKFEGEEDTNFEEKDVIEITKSSETKRYS